MCLRTYCSLIKQWITSRDRRRQSRARKSKNIFRSVHYCCVLLNVDMQTTHRFVPLLLLIYQLTRVHNIPRIMRASAFGIGHFSLARCNLLLSMLNCIVNDVIMHVLMKSLLDFRSNYISCNAIFIPIVNFLVAPVGFRAEFEVYFSPNLNEYKFHSRRSFWRIDNDVDWWPGAECKQDNVVHLACGRGTIECAQGIFIY